jgi:hypothetical protein
MKYLGEEEWSFMSRNTTCSECGGKMERGFVVDTAGDIGMLLDAAYWVEGRPEKSIWTGLKVMKKEKHYITAYRCETCGFLKFYAGPVTTKN